ncbi:MAG: nucleotidyltransferase [Clostridiales bacterium]|nr:nucleotidyltransferase [Clostridiales bacterium]
MKVVGIVSEYNPFHNGHKYHLQLSKKLCKADYSLAIMSGNFLQRGEPALFDKWSRAKMAVINGIDLVIELPVIYSCQSAELFAFGAIKILDSLKVVDYLSFGSENGNIHDLYKAAETLLNEPDYVKVKIRSLLDEGMTYSKAISQAYSGLMGNLLSYPNNILGIEYIKSLLLINSSIKPITVKRIGNNYNDTVFKGSISSATAIREGLKTSGLTKEIKDSIPEASWRIVVDNIKKGKGPIFWDNFSDILLYHIRKSTHQSMRNLPEIKEGLEYRFKKAGDASSCFEELVNLIKTKRYTRTLLQRNLCHMLLDINKKDIEYAKRIDSPIYVRVLALNNKGRSLLKEIGRKSNTPIINKAADFKASSSFLERMFYLDVLATDIYNLGYNNKKYKLSGEDFRTSPFYAELP